MILCFVSNLVPLLDWTDSLFQPPQLDSDDDDKYKRRSVLTWFARWLRSQHSTSRKGTLNPSRPSTSSTRSTIYVILIILFVFVTIITVLYHLTRGENNENLNLQDDPQFNPLNNPFIRVGGRLLKNPLKDSNLPLDKEPAQWSRRIGFSLLVLNRQVETLISYWFILFSIPVHFLSSVDQFCSFCYLEEGKKIHLSLRKSDIDLFFLSRWTSFDVFSPHPRRTAPMPSLLDCWTEIHGHSNGKICNGVPLVGHYNIHLVIIYTVFVCSPPVVISSLKSIIIRPVGCVSKRRHENGPFENTWQHAKIAPSRTIWRWS